MSSSSSTVKDLFLEAIEQYAPEQWPAFVDRTCAGQPQMRKRLNLLLAAHSADESLLDAPALTLPTGASRWVVEQPGTEIGAYTIERKIGEGGMGVVYLARQEQPVKRRVALKIIRPGMDTQQVIARFAVEQKTLAMMDHPNIARVLDAGTTQDGRPFFVMEFVEGIPVTEYCDKHQLTPKQRLELFIPICQAVQHAHQKGIIHRDLKPSNILVAIYDGQAVPKVIDFGVSKAISQTLGEATTVTQLGQIVGTLQYMAPEQARRSHADVDTRSDIYSLGVVLYELLTGDTPFGQQQIRSAGLDEMLRLIREEDPPKPSTRLSSGEIPPAVAENRCLEPQRLTAMVRGDLDWIVMTAMDKDPGRRYEAAGNFADDIRRYLQNEPVFARPPSLGYRFRKFAARNRTALAAGSLVAAALVLGVVGTTWQAIRATRAERQLQQRLVEVKAAHWKAEESFKKMIQSRVWAMASTGGLLAERREYQLADEQFRRALELDPRNAMANNNYAWFLVTCPDSQFQDAAAALPLAEGAVAADPKSGLFHNTLGVAHYRLGNWEEARQSLERSQELFGDKLYSHNGFFLAMIQWQLNRPLIARQLYEQSVAWLQENDPNNPELLRFCAEAGELLSEAPEAEEIEANAGSDSSDSGN